MPSHAQQQWHTRSLGGSSACDRCRAIQRDRMAHGIRRAVCALTARRTTTNCYQAQPGCWAGGIGRSNRPRRAGSMIGSKLPMCASATPSFSKSHSSTRAEETSDLRAAQRTTRMRTAKGIISGTASAITRGGGGGGATVTMRRHRRSTRRQRRLGRAAVRKRRRRPPRAVGRHRASAAAPRAGVMLAAPRPATNEHYTRGGPVFGREAWGLDRL